MNEKLLIDEIKKMHGNVLCIGNFNEKVLDTIDKNNNITICNILSDIDNSTSSTIKSKTKKFSLKKLRKFKKKKVNYLIVNYNKIDDYLDTFIKDSIYITSEFIYLYSLNQKLIKRYKHYKVKIKKHENLIIIDTKDAKNNRIKEFFYTIYDIIIDSIDYISDMIIKG